MNLRKTAVPGIDLPGLPEGSDLVVIEGGSHMVFVEKPYYHDFQNRLTEFLNR